jgi:hypothetical protein
MDKFSHPLLMHSFILAFAMMFGSPAEVQNPQALLVPTTPLLISAPTTNSYITNQWGLIFSNIDYGTATTGNQFQLTNNINYSYAVRSYLGSNSFARGMFFYTGSETGLVNVVVSNVEFVTAATLPVPFTATVGHTLASMPMSYSNAATFANLVWTNYLALRNGKTALIWSSTSYTPLSFIRNTNSIIFGVKGATAFTVVLSNSLSAGDASQYYGGDSPATVLTRRLIYGRGHSGGDTGRQIVTNKDEYWFFDSNNQPVLVKTYALIGTSGYNTNTGIPEDYGLRLTETDIPTNIESMTQIRYNDLWNGGNTNKYYFEGNGVNYQLVRLGFEVYGPACYSIYSYGYSMSDPLTGNDMIPGDSGSPNCFIVPTTNGQTLVMYSGRTTTGVDDQMLTDAYAIEAWAGIDTNNPAYQINIMELTNYPNMEY